MPENRAKSAMGGKKPTQMGKLRAASERNIASSDYTVIRDADGEPTGVTRPMPDEKPGAFAGMPVKMRNVDLAKPASFNNGGVVQKTGMAMVHKGEQVIPADAAPRMRTGEYRPGTTLTRVKRPIGATMGRTGDIDKDVARTAQALVHSQSEDQAISSKYKVMSPVAEPSSFEEGGEVKKSGWAQVEKGEQVISKAKAGLSDLADRAGKAVQKYNPFAGLSDEAKGVSAKTENVEQYKSGTKAEPSKFKHGGVVKKSGMAHVEKGETILPKDHPMADEKRDRTKSAMGGKGKGKKKSSKGGKKRVKKMSIRHSKNGGYIIEHTHDRPSPNEPEPEPEEHTAPDMEALQQHVADHMEPQPEQAQAAPQPGPAGPPAGGAPPPGM